MAAQITTSNSNGYTSISDLKKDYYKSTYNISNIFENTKKFKDVTKYRLMRGVPDFGNLVQFNPYETGYACFIICEMPKFIEILGQRNSSYYQLIQNWKHIVEAEFKSFEGLDNITTEPVQLGTEENQFNVIGKTNMQGGASEFSLQYDEKVGSIFTKFSRLYLNNIMDPRLHIKTYGGLIHDGTLAPGIENETFTFLFMSLDNTLRDIEASYLITSSQLLESSTDIYNYSKGTIEKKDITLKFSGYPIQHPYIDKISKELITYLLSDESNDRQILLNDLNYDYTGLENAVNTLKGYGFNEKLLYNGNGYAPVSDLKQDYYGNSINGNPNGYVPTDYLRGIGNSGSYTVIPKAEPAPSSVTNPSPSNSNSKSPSSIVNSEKTSQNTISINLPSNTSLRDIFQSNNAVERIKQLFNCNDREANIYNNIFKYYYNYAVEKSGYKESANGGHSFDIDDDNLIYYKTVINSISGKGSSVKITENNNNTTTIAVVGGGSTYRLTLNGHIGD